MTPEGDEHLHSVAWDENTVWETYAEGYGRTRTLHRGRALNESGQPIGRDATALGRGVPLPTADRQAAVRTSDGVIEFPTTGLARQLRMVSIPTEDGPRIFATLDDGETFNEVQFGGDQ